MNLCPRETLFVKFYIACVVVTLVVIFVEEIVSPGANGLFNGVCKVSKYLWDKFLRINESLVFPIKNKVE